LQGVRRSSRLAKLTCCVDSGAAEPPEQQRAPSSLPPPTQQQPQPVSGTTAVTVAHIHTAATTAALPSVPVTTTPPLTITTTATPTLVPATTSIAMQVNGDDGSVAEQEVVVIQRPAERLSAAVTPSTSHAQQSTVPSITPTASSSYQNANYIGITNPGSSCYMNSVLQMLFHLQPFRAVVYNAYDALHSSIVHSRTSMDMLVAMLLHLVVTLSPRISLV